MRAPAAIFLAAAVCLLLSAAQRPSSQAPAGYVDDAVCASCHADIARSYSEAGMARSFVRPTRDRIIETLDKPFVHARSKQIFEMVWRGDRLVFRRFQRDDAGKARNLLEQPVDWILGSGDHARVYLYQTPEGEL
ncbi:MAG: hypothetical protein JOZ54_08855, partial [Acidobacteria bacterium]|nr:hypothetical protein [Acidobacteriota bacterium]